MQMRKDAVAHQKDQRKRSRQQAGIQDSDSEDETPDEVRLYEDGFKDRYYESKFGVYPEDQHFRYRVAAEYTLGLCWVLRYKSGFIFEQLLFGVRIVFKNNNQALYLSCYYLVSELFFKIIMRETSHAKSA